MNGGREEERRKCCKIVFIANDCSLSRLEKDCSNVFVDNLRMSTGERKVSKLNCCVIKEFLEQGKFSTPKVSSKSSYQG